MSEMIERGARAAYEVNPWAGVPWEHLPSAAKDEHRAKTRAVLVAMRGSVTQEMGLAFANYWHDNFRPAHVLEDTPAADCWHAMIDAALA